MINNSLTEKNIYFIMKIYRNMEEKLYLGISEVRFSSRSEWYVPGKSRNDIVQIKNKTEQNKQQFGDQN